VAALLEELEVALADLCSLHRLQSRKPCSFWFIRAPCHGNSRSETPKGV
jgi:hypothetical protein